MEKWIIGRELCKRWKIDANKLYWVIMDEGLPLYNGDGESTSLDALILSCQIDEIIDGSMPDDSQPQKIAPEQYASLVNMPEKVLRKQFPIPPMMADALMSVFFRAEQVGAVEQLYGFPLSDDRPPQMPRKPRNAKAAAWGEVITYARTEYERGNTLDTIANSHKVDGIFKKYGLPTPEFVTIRKRIQGPGKPGRPPKK
jgi:hypothetical protein